MYTRENLDRKSFIAHQIVWFKIPYRDDTLAVHKLRVEYGRGCRDCIYRERCETRPELFFDLIHHFGMPTDADIILNNALINIKNMRKE